MQTIISHRGNLDGPTPSLENRPSYIENAIQKGFDVEIDLRVEHGKLFLGHDKSQYDVNLEWLLHHSENLWVHCKDVNALEICLQSHNLRCFFHEKERHTIISNHMIWTHDIEEAVSSSIIPLISEKVTSNTFFEKYFHVYGICTDYANYYSALLKVPRNLK